MGIKWNADCEINNLISCPQLDTRYLLYFACRTNTFKVSSIYEFVPSTWYH